MQLIQTPSRIFVCDVITSIHTGLVTMLCSLIFNEAFINQPLKVDIAHIAFQQPLMIALYTTLFTLLLSPLNLIYYRLRKKTIGLRFVIDHLGIHYGEIDEMESIPWHRFVGMQMNGSGPFQRVIVFALNQKTPLVIDLKAFNFTQREAFKQVLKQKIRFYCPTLTHRYIPELAY
ncbi:hypothetical protein [uncultured Shewanella sp.]|uniref:hypothetical protein n=1 Tax=uncultured Shewanella sp. TaxID=173975 RepID=UPI0026162D74|nr:hypothetical protein [uncultured Shewanella sp.]